MIDHAIAHGLAAANLAPGLRLGLARELANGWFFPYLRGQEVVFGTPQGVIVNKRSGHLVTITSGEPLQRCLELYDKGFQYEVYDLVITTVEDLSLSIDLLSKIPITVVEPEYEGGVVWRVPRSLSATELRDRLEKLPAVFSAIHNRITVSEALEHARQTGAVSFELVECSPKDDQ